LSGRVATAKRIEQVVRLERIADSTEKKSLTRKKKETEVHNIEGGYKGKKNKLPN
jgi:hypothetical protein